MIPDPREHPTLSAAEAAPLLGISERSTYVGANEWTATKGQSGIPAIRVGRSVRILTAPLLRMIGLQDEPQVED